MMVLGLVMALLSPQVDGQDPAAASTDEVAKKPPFDEQALREALKISGLQFTDAELAQLLPAALDRIGDYAALRSRSIENAVPPASQFRPLEGSPTVTAEQLPAADPLPDAIRPDDLQ
ncbi:MAG TPA: hypothetical protein EYN40_04335, partial [Planctomycetes bacterium]|nr:hypothetical protein [Planctomycetota bacterium]